MKKPVWIVVAGGMALGLAVMCPGLCSATFGAVITVQLQGTIFNVADPLPPPTIRFSAVTFGTPFTVAYTYDDALADSDPDPNLGHYAPVSLVASFAGYTFSSAAASVDVANDLPSGIEGLLADEFTVTTDPSLTAASGTFRLNGTPIDAADIPFLSSRAKVELTNLGDGTAIDSDQLIVPSIPFGAAEDDTPLVTFACGAPGYGACGAEGFVDSVTVTPEPAGLAAAVGSLMVGLERANLFRERKRGSK